MSELDRRLLDAIDALNDADEPASSYYIGQRAGTKGSPINDLARLEAAGRVVSWWEDPAPTGRPRRRLYRTVAP